MRIGQLGTGNDCIKRREGYASKRAQALDVYVIKRYCNARNNITDNSNDGSDSSP